MYILLASSLDIPKKKKIETRRTVGAIIRNKQEVSAQQQPQQQIKVVNHKERAHQFIYKNRQRRCVLFPIFYFAF